MANQPARPLPPIGGYSPWSSRSSSSCWSLLALAAVRWGADSRHQRVDLSRFARRPRSPLTTPPDAPAAALTRPAPADDPVSATPRPTPRRPSRRTPGRRAIERPLTAPTPSGPPHTWDTTQIAASGARRRHLRRRRRARPPRRRSRPTPTSTPCHGRSPTGRSPRRATGRPRAPHRAPGRRPIRAEGPARHRRRAHHLRLVPPPRPRAGEHGHVDPAAGRRRRHPRRQGEPARVRLGHHVAEPVPRPRGQPATPRPHPGRLERRQRGGGGLRAGAA